LWDSWARRARHAVPGHTGPVRGLDLRAADGTVLAAPRRRWAIVFRKRTADGLASAAATIDMAAAAFAVVAADGRRVAAYDETHHVVCGGADSRCWRGRHPAAADKGALAGLVAFNSMARAGGQRPRAGAAGCWGRHAASDDHYDQALSGEGATAAGRPGDPAAPGGWR